MDVARAEAHQSLYSRLHRIKNLVSVSGVQLRSELRQSEPSSELHSRFYRILTQHEESYNGLVENLQTLRMEAPVLELIDLNKLLESLLRELESICKTKRIECRPVLGTHLPAVKGDSSQLKEAFHNLFINSVDAMQHGGVLQIESIYQQQSSGVQISFTDTGIGIPEAVQHRIFQPGYTLKQSGSGFGLNIVQRTVRAHMGRIDLQSEEGSGATFTIYRPVNPEAVPIKMNLQMRPIFYEARHDLAFEELV